MTAGGFANSAVEGVLGLLSTMSEKDKERVREYLTILPPPCKKNGHKYKVLDHHKGLFSWTTYTRIFCQACGDVRKK